MTSCRSREVRKHALATTDPPLPRYEVVATMKRQPSASSFKPDLLVEHFRLRSLKQTGVIPRNVSFVHSDLALLSVELNMPVCAVTLVGKHFQYLKATIGTDLTLMHRDHAFCSHTILQDGVMVVEDTAADARFSSNPYVVDGPRLRFYAGAPLRTANGQKLGAVCIMDRKPRELHLDARERLAAAAIVISTKLCFNEPGPDLSRISIGYLLGAIRRDSSCDDEKIMLINALYARLDEAADLDAAVLAEPETGVPS